MDLSWLPAFVCFVMGILILGLTFKHSLEKTDIRLKLDWKRNLEKEHELQFIRATTIPEELFLKVDFSEYPITKEPKCQAVYLKLLVYAKVPIAYLGRKSNLEIKAQFGAKGLETLTNYERNYFNFMDISYEYGNILYDNGFLEEAQRVLELNIGYGCDSSKNFLLLSQIYKLRNEFDALKQLKEAAMKNMETSPLLEKVLSQLS